MSLVTPRPASAPYSSGLRNPTGAPSFWFSSATSPAHSGATALVPPMTRLCPSTRTSYPVAGSASPPTSGTPRPCWLDPATGGTFAAAWYAGGGKKTLTPPPVALSVPSFHTVSDAIDAPDAISLVPPQPSAYGLDAGKSTCGLPSATPSPEPLSPAAQQTVTPIVAAAWNAWSNWVIDCAVQFDSAEPQLIEIASRKPWSVLGAK